jgi:hypothetical protein
MVVDPYSIGSGISSADKPFRVRWTVVGSGVAGIGTFPLAGSEGNEMAVCYFSDEDINATCGPSPITSTGTYTLIFHLITPRKVENFSKTFNITEIDDLNDVNLIVDGNKVYISLIHSNSEVDSVQYAVYKDVEKTGGTTPVTYLQSLTYTICGNVPCFSSNYTLPGPGNYYFSFIAKKGSDIGGLVKRVYLAAQTYLNINTDKSIYAPEQQLAISGNTSAMIVRGVINYPNATKARDLEMGVSGNVFSYSFTIPSGWPTGQYTISTSEPLVKSVTFSVTRFITTDVTSISETVEKFSNFTKNIKIENNGIEALNISYEALGGLRNDQLKLDSFSLPAGGSTYLHLNISSVQNDTIGRIKIYSTNSTLEIPVEIRLKTACQCPQCPACEGSGLTASPQIWSEECLVGKDVVKTFTLSNKGSSTAANLTYTVEKISGSSIKNIVDVELPSSLSSGGTGEATVTITPDMSGGYGNILKIQSSAGTAQILISLNCYANITDDIKAARTDLKAASVSSSLQAEIKSHLTSAQDAYDMGLYAEASLELEKAKLLLDAGSSLGGGIETPNGGGDLLIPIIAVIAVIGLVAAIFLKIRSKPKQQGQESWETDVGGPSEQGY